MPYDIDLVEVRSYDRCDFLAGSWPTQEEFESTSHSHPNINIFLRKCPQVRDETGLLHVIEVTDLEILSTQAQILPTISIAH